MTPCSACKRLRGHKPSCKRLRAWLAYGPPDVYIPLNDGVILNRGDALDGERATERAARMARHGCVNPYDWDNRPRRG